MSVFNFQSSDPRESQHVMLECTSPPFLWSEEDDSIELADTSGKTSFSVPTGRCNQNMAADDDDDDDHDDEADCEFGKKELTGSSQLGTGKSFQDIHSNYTKRRYKHVSSKVAQYIASIQEQESKKKRTKFQRHSSMPDTQMQLGTPKARPRNSYKSAEELQLSCHRSEDDGRPTSSDRDERYERLRAKYEQMMRNVQDLYQVKLVQLQHRIDLMQADLSTYEQKFQQQADSATGSKLPRAHHAHHENHANLSRLTYGSSEGSIEMALMSVAPTVVHAKTRQDLMRPISLDFSLDEAERSANGVVRSARSQQRSTTNNNSDQPSSNDSAIEVERELRSPSSHESRREEAPAPPPQRIYYFDSRKKCLIELEVVRKKKRSLGSRMFKWLVPCVRCQNPNQSLDMSAATYAGVPLLDENTPHHN